MSKRNFDIVYSGTVTDSANRSHHNNAGSALIYHDILLSRYTPPSCLGSENEGCGSAEPGPALPARGWTLELPGGGKYYGFWAQISICLEWPRVGG